MDHLNVANPSLENPQYFGTVTTMVTVEPAHGYIPDT